MSEWLNRWRNELVTEKMGAQQMDQGMKDQVCEWMHE